MSAHQRTSGAAGLARAIADTGVEEVFGTVGHGNLAFVDALIDTDLRFTSVHHEQVAAHAADAYFRISRRLSVVTTTVGPGFTNLATGLGDALLDSSAFVVIAGGVPTDTIGREPLQELSLHSDDAQHEVFRHLTKRVFRATTAAGLPDLFRKAARTALAGNPGPVIVHVPLDLFSATVDVQASAPARMAVPRPGPDPNQIRAAVEVLAAAERPLLYAGGGALISGAEDEIAALAVRFGIPVATTMSGQGILDEAHDLAVGMTGVVGTKPANELIRDADVVVAVGTRFPEMDASSWRNDHFAAFPPARLIHVDVDPAQIDKIYPADVAIVSDAKLALAALLTELDTVGAAVSSDTWLKQVATAKDRWRNELEPIRASDVFPLEPAAMLTDLRALLPDDAVLVSGVGIRHAVGQHFAFRRPRTQVVGSGFGTMGQEIPAVIGARAAAPSGPVVGVVGDGALMACLAAWPTAVSAGTDATWIVLDNGGYASIAVYQSKHFDRHLGTSFAGPDGGAAPYDYVKLAQSFGMSARRATSKPDFVEAVRAAIAEPGPSVVVAPVTPTPRLIASGHWDVNDILAATGR